MTSRARTASHTRKGLAGVLALLPALALALLACSGPAPGDLDSADQEFTGGNLFQAQHLYEEYLQRKPGGEERWHAWSRLLDIAQVHDDRRRAASLMESMLLEFADQPNRDGQLLHRLAGVYEELRDWDRALETWQRLLTHKATAPGELWEIYWRTGKIFQYQGQYAQAQDALTGCLDTALDDLAKARCLYDLAQTQSLLKQRSQAKDSLNRLLALHVEDPELNALAAYLLADICEGEGNAAKARELLTSILDTYPNPLAVRNRLEQLGK